MLKYKMIDPLAAEEFQRFLIDLVPRYGRISAYPDTGILAITDSAPNVKRIIEVLHSIDKPMSATFKRDLAQRRAERRKQVQSAATPKLLNSLPLNSEDFRFRSFRVLITVGKLLK